MEQSCAGGVEDKFDADFGPIRVVPSIGCPFLTIVSRETLLFVFFTAWDVAGGIPIDFGRV